MSSANVDELARQHDVLENRVQASQWMIIALLSLITAVVTYNSGLPVVSEVLLLAAVVWGLSMFIAVRAMWRNWKLSKSEVSEA